MKKVLLSSIILLLIFSSNSVFADYTEISCSTDSVFSENSCTQCFDGGERSENSNGGQHFDLWMNSTSKPMYMLKSENPLDRAVRMISLNGAAWSYEPTQEGFWEYSPNLEDLSNDEGFYTLDSNKSVYWIQSKLGYSIRLNQAPEAGQNAGLLKYVLNVHIDDDGSPEEKVTSHSECVLFKSSSDITDEIIEEETNEELPQTGPQEVLLLLLALILSGLLFFASRKKI